MKEISKDYALNLFDKWTGGRSECLPVNESELKFYTDEGNIKLMSFGTVIFFPINGDGMKCYSPVFGEIYRKFVSM